MSWRLTGVAWAALALLASLAWGEAQETQVYKTRKDFLAQTFSTAAPTPGVLWMRGEVKTRAAAILGHPYRSLRVRYWRQGDRTAWILDEIGKERPITSAFLVRAGRIERTEVLAFRESRGWEIRHDFFTRQFVGAGLDAEGELDRRIDGISGATLSVEAMGKMARLALFLDSQIPQP